MPTTPDISALAGPFPHGPTRGRTLDWICFQIGKTGQRARRMLTGRKTRPHRIVLAAAVAMVLKHFPRPTCIETGCIRDANEGTDSTLAIASALGGRGRFYTFESEPAHIDTCKIVCRDFADHIRYVQGDAKLNLRRLRDERVLEVVHLAFFDSMDDPDQIWEEYKAVEDLLIPGSLVIVDDAIRGVKGRRVKPYLRFNPHWATLLVHSGNGMLLALNTGE